MQGRDPPHLEQMRDFVLSFAKPAAWLQARFSGVAAVIGQACPVVVPVANRSPAWLARLMISLRCCPKH